MAALSRSFAYRLAYFFPTRNEPLKPLCRYTASPVKPAVSEPFDPDELVARVQRLVQRAGVRDAASSKGLTRRELDVLRPLANGRTQVEIATDLKISPKTVATHIERIMGKLGVHSRAQAVAIARRQRFVEA